MTKIRDVKGGGQIFFCPGCNDVHQVNTSGPRWDYNGKPDAPTFKPSILVTMFWSEADREAKNEVCHSFVTDGRIQFLGDCTHSLAGQTVDLPDWPYSPGAFGGIIEPEAT